MSFLWMEGGDLYVINNALLYAVFCSEGCWVFFSRAVRASGPKWNNCMCEHVKFQLKYLCYNMLAFTPAAWDLILLTTARLLFEHCLKLLNLHLHESALSLMVHDDDDATWLADWINAWMSFWLFPGEMTFHWNVYCTSWIVEWKKKKKEKKLYGYANIFFQFPLVSFCVPALTSALDSFLYPFFFNIKTFFLCSQQEWECYKIKVWRGGEEGGKWAMGLLVKLRGFSL